MTTTEKKAITIRVFTNSGTNASQIGERHSYGSNSWRSSIDSCDSDGCGRVFIDCENDEDANYLCEQLEKDDDVFGYDVYSK